MQSLRAFIDAVEAFGLRLAGVHWEMLAAAVGCGIANLILRARAWQRILQTALPASRIRYPSCFGAYCAGVGVNAIAPARTGDVVKMFLIRRRTPESRYPVLVGTLVAETLTDMLMGLALIVWALRRGFLPGLRLPHIPAFDLSLAFRHPIITGVGLVAVGVIVFLLGRRIRAFWRQFGQGMAIVRRPLRYVRSVSSYQLVGWCFRVAAAAFFLRAFGLPLSIDNALIVMVAGSLGGLFPGTPGGLGPKQALLVVMLAGVAGRTDVLAFSAGTELTLVVVNVTLGLTCAALMLRSLRIRGALARARADRGDPAAP